jgi:hypothetical protein
MSSDVRFQEKRRAPDHLQLLVNKTLIESRNPELVAAARAALKRYSDEAPRQAE